MPPALPTFNFFLHRPFHEFSAARPDRQILQLARRRRPAPTDSGAT
jgi:hypothetical protein